MKRHLDAPHHGPVAKDRPGVVPEPPADEELSAEGLTISAVKSQVAASLVALAMHDSAGPIDNLSRALGRMQQALAAIDTAARGRTGAARASDLETWRDVFAREIAVCIQSMQFHDRLSQQLEQARAILAGVAINSRLAGITTAAANEGSIELF